MCLILSFIIHILHFLQENHYHYLNFKYSNRNPSISIFRFSSFNAEIPLPKQTLENTISGTNQETTNPSISITLLNSLEVTLVITPEETFLDSFNSINAHIYIENSPICMVLLQHMYF